MRVLAPVVLAMVGCIAPASVPCDDGSYCPSNTTCRAVTDPDQVLCASAAQIEQCVGRDRYAQCTTDAIAHGRCYDGVCIAVACGNGRIDRPDPTDPADHGEVCDDRNATSGDGCSSDCSSDETCGNGVVDPIALELCDDGNLVQHDGCDSTCHPELPAWSEVTATSPDARSSAGFAYDAARDRAVLFGGASTGGKPPLGDTWELGPFGWISLHPAIAPNPRSGHMMAYDPARRRTVLFGGTGGGIVGSFNDTWEWDGNTWTPIAIASPPRPRDGAVGTYDGRRQRIVMFGGVGNFGSGTAGASDELWAWDGTTWTLLSPLHASPVTALDGLAIAYDPLHDRMVVFADTQTWTYDAGANTWMQATGAAPPPRRDATLAWDVRTQRIVLYGGSSGGSAFGDTWAWDGASWSPVATPTPPSPRTGHAMVATARGLVVFGGIDDTETPLDETWLAASPSDAAWTQVVPVAPGAPYVHLGSVGQLAAVYDSVRGSTLVYGRSGAAPNGGTWEFDGAGFRALAPATQPPPINTTSLAYDSARHVAVMYRGEDVVWEWDGTDWRSIAPPSPPPARVASMLAYDATAQRTIMFGGEAAGGHLADTWAWDGVAWTQLAPAHAPPAREDGVFAWDPVARQAVLFGGSGDGGVLGDTWVWANGDWSERTSTSRPAARSAATIAWNPSRACLTLFGGGESPTGVFADTWEWRATPDGAGGAWTQVVVAQAPQARNGPLALVGANSVWVMGGARGLGQNLTVIDDLWQLRWSGADPDETCALAVDNDGDKRVGCADPDCWTRCAPDCPPGTSCAAPGEACGDGTCNAAIETCRNCPSDCPCVPVCGDAFCDTGEIATCPGDCP